ncbi:hypothetical protein NC661_14485 [Aquibacillus koreensis]|uniref:Lipoprotein n=1 Tax=Aquibacillus koreensis TaxID=279446 RepID=A0A9X3WMY6_9BACI|nr:hypothetical protein [Aquibacillus koreensis]MCT2537230.1 hypothetical protein [Aquibacillus koreensis]MDC3421578.1 hypothetical protein [Aquibacillus koreensis]
MVRHIFVAAISILFLVGCGASLQQEQSQQVIHNKKQTALLEISNQPVKKVDNVTEQDEIVATTEEVTTVEHEKEEKNQNISPKLLVELTDELDQVHRRVVEKIEANGWYESIDTIEPSVEEFDQAIRPIVAPYFTKAFIDREVIGKMEAFFCYCDAPGPLQGTLIPDLFADTDQKGERISYNAYRPANEMYTGAKIKVTAAKEQDSWKIDAFEMKVSSHEQSFSITLEQVLAYYQAKGVEVRHIETDQDRNGEAIFIVETVADGKKIAVHSADWFTIDYDLWVEWYK